ncbi:MAG TPA: ElyC/SanA/YdcF family protein [Opitutaceae bacterium]|jgi:uncharacterized SAM-binding protein YcdF (DUF218 family)|nr:ElyC/SanA/YdcF family protein [Opitutaceae bacterium]
MAFWLKKVAEYWLMPVPFCLALLALGLWRMHRARAGAKGLIWAAFLLLLAGSNEWISIRLVEPLEWRFPPAPALLPGAPIPAELAACRYIVVLGAGHADSTRLPALERLSPSALGRLTEALRILRRLPGAILVLSGPARDGGAAHAAVLAAAAESLGAPRSRMRLIDTAWDTAQEAAAARALVGNGPVALVTSAVHMPRAAALFRHEGIVIYPCPADYNAKPQPGLRWSDLRCDVESLDRTTTFVRERLGMLWLRLRGKVG